MSTEENKALIIRFEEAANQGNLAAFDELCSPDLVVPGPIPGLAPGLEGIKQATVMYHAAFPDYAVTIEDLIAEGDRVVSRSTLHGTHQGTFMGIPATGKRVAAGGIDIFRIADGKIVEWWAAYDSLGMMQQLGVIPAMGEARN